MEKYNTLAKQLINECKENGINCMIAFEDEKGFKCTYCYDSDAELITKLIDIAEETKEPY